jgi:hypothetical protein
MTTATSEPLTESAPLRRLVLGGVMGGLLSNISGIALVVLVLHADASKFLRAMENPPSGTRMFVEHVLIRFGFGLAAAWLFWAIRPRFEKRTRATLGAATFLWLTAYLFPALLLEELRIYTTRTAVSGAAWGFVELVLVVAVAASFLRDEAVSQR